MRIFEKLPVRIRAKAFILKHKLGEFFEQYLESGASLKAAKLLREIELNKKIPEKVKSKYRAELKKIIQEHVEAALCEIENNNPNLRKKFIKY